MKLTARNSDEEFCIPIILVLPQRPAVGDGEIIGITGSSCIPHMGEFGSLSLIISLDTRSVQATYQSTISPLQQKR